MLFTNKLLTSGWTLISSLASSLLFEIRCVIPEFNKLVLKKPVTVKIPVFVSHVELHELLQPELLPTPGVEN